MTKAEQRKIQGFLKTLEKIRLFIISKSETPDNPHDVMYDVLNVQSVEQNLKRFLDVPEEKPKYLLDIPERERRMTTKEIQAAGIKLLTNIGECYGKTVEVIFFDKGCLQILFTDKTFISFSLSITDYPGIFLDKNEDWN